MLYHFADLCVSPRRRSDPPSPHPPPCPPPSPPPHAPLNLRQGQLGIVISASLLLPHAASKAAFPGAFPWFTSTVGAVMLAQVQRGISAVMSDLGQKHSGDYNVLNPTVRSV